MIQIIYRLLTCLMLYFLSGAVAANSAILEKYAWTNRLVVLITNKNGSSLETQVKRFFETQTCEIDDRNLKLLHLQIGKPTAAQLPKTMNQQTGLWLLGYDGLIKDFSEDGRLLSRLFQTIDGMPMRQDEMASESACG